ncbi:MAG: peptide chain release factor 3 [Rhodothermaceae bacterium]|nr:MAG: peptide chain release factor 3 [Rhodothermaceae bacterium]
MKHWIDTLAEQLEAQEAPVLSLYLDVNPAHADNLKEGYRIRAENAMKAAGVPQALIDEVVARFEADPPHKHGRTLVLFATEDPEALFETHYLQVDLPLVSEMERVIARWGVPYVAPLLLVRDDYERYAVVYMDRERWRYFDVYLGEIEEVKEAFLAVDTTEWRKLTEPAAGSPAIPAVGAGHDLYEDRVEAWVHRFYKQAAELLEKAMTARGAQRLILCGPEERRVAFEEVLPKAVREKVVARLSGLPYPDASPAQVLDHIEDAIEEAERAGEVALLGRIREHGVWGLNDVLLALQEGRLYTVAVPWTPRVLRETVYRCPETGFVGVDEAAVQAACTPGATLETARLDEVLPELAVRHGSHLEFVRGEAERLLTDEMGGIAGLRRW